MPPSKIEITLLILLLFVLSTTVIWVRTANVRATYDYVQRESELKALTLSTQDLRIQWSRLTSPQRLKTISGNLKMDAPKISQVLKLDSGVKNK